MTGWLTYTPSDLLLFSATTYYRLFERYNRDIWPVQLIVPACGLAIVLLLRYRPTWHGRAISAMLGAGWAWVAWAYHLQRYAIINWAAPVFAAGFVLQAMVMIWAGVVRGRLNYRFSPTAARLVGGGLFLYAMIGQPLTAPIVGRGWMQAELAGLAPDPTAVVTLGMLSMVEGPPRWPLLIIPTIWCLFSGAVLWQLGSPEGIAVPTAAAAAVVCAGLAARRHRFRRADNPTDAGVQDPCRRSRCQSPN